MNKNKYLIILLFITFLNCFSQHNQKFTPSEIYDQIEKLNFFGSVLYIAAHPDDENTKLITYFANHQNARTGYLSLTRGDGGQNLIGTEMGEQLGVLRTQELLAARRIDGGEQFFTRANDFGFSKNPDETFTIWDKTEVLSDVVLAIRKFRPDIIINRFDHRTPGTTHGHHTASALLSLEAFDLANNATSYPEQLTKVELFQPKRIFFNTSWWFYGSEENFNKADKSRLFNINTGVYYSLRGKSNGEIAALSRSQHKCQGFGTTGTRGDETDYLEFIKGDFPENKYNLFEGINTTWTRVEDGDEIGKILNTIQANFNFKDPSAHLPKLLQAYSLILKLKDEHWKNIKKQQLENIIIGCAGLYFEANTSVQNSNPNNTINLKIEATNRSNFDILLNGIEFNNQPIHRELVHLQQNKPYKSEKEITIPASFGFTSPYWLDEQGTLGMYKVTDTKTIGVPETERPKLVWKLTICETPFEISKEIAYKYNNPAKGEIYQPFDLLPEVTTEITNRVHLFTSRGQKQIMVKVKAGKDTCHGEVFLDLPADWRVAPDSHTFKIDKKGSEQLFVFHVTPPSYSTEATVKSYAMVNGVKMDKKMVTIDYDHIPLQKVVLPSEARFIKVDLKTKGSNIGYIMGAGDDIPENLRQMGYTVTLITPEKINREYLKQFDAILTGIRAYNTVDALKFKQTELFAYVKNGGTLIVQYNTDINLVTKELAPYELLLSKDRITEENAKVRFLAAKNAVLNTPNKITEKDFECWVQERGLYFPKKWSKEFTPIITANDTNEKPLNSGILTAKYGKGHYIYTALSFFREIPEGVPGAYRLLANLIAIGK